MQGTYVLVDYNGTSSCKVDITYFPFDDQKCILRFGSWIYSGLWMNYVTMHQDRPIDLGNYVNNSEWDLLSVILNKNIRTHSCCPDPHPDLTYLLHIRRKTFYYIFNIIVPCIMLFILTLLTFWLPLTSGEKITLGLSVFLAFSMFMLLIAEEVRATSEAVPLIGIYLCVVMTMTSLSVIMAVIVINVYNHGTKAKRAPPWVRKLVLDWMSRPLGIRHHLERLVHTSHRDSKRDRNECTKVAENRIHPTDIDLSINSRSQNKAISKIVDAMSKDDDNSEQEMYYRKMVVAEWQRIAAVIDRVLFWIYFLGTIASYVVILIIIPGKNYTEWDAEVKQVRAMQNSQGFTLQ
ncbi:hypothetical protein ACJMK2_021570 [Sinanodonta woodiana]|uniref:Uncharacterized protein n=1 Tax=Sinanodonta woodiana TaxID=1069815 RepID=A0ABD3TGG0_SINWO